MKSPPLSSVISSDSFTSSLHDPVSPGVDENPAPKTSLGDSTGQNVVIPGNSYDDYFHEARERFQYGLLAKNFWRTPYPPEKTKKDYAREAEHRKGRPQRRPMSMIVSSKDAELHRDNGFENDTLSIRKLYGSYEGLFMSRIFDLFFKLLESPMEQNLLVTSILQKIAGVVDKRVDGVICEWRAIRVGGDGALYGGVWTLPSGKGNRRSLYSMLEQVTFEALKRAQLVPNFETRISIAKKRGVLAGHNPPVQHAAHPKRSASSYTLSSSTSTPRDNGKRSLSRHPSLSQLVFSKGASSPVNEVPASPSSPSGTKSTGLMSLRVNTTPHNNGNSREKPNAAYPPPTKSTNSSTSSRGSTSNGNSNGSSTSTANTSSNNGASSPSTSFFQQSQRTNATPVTMTNPFAKLSNFVNSYIVLQEFCKELAAVILVRHASNNNESGLMRYQDHHHKRESMFGASNDYWLEERTLDDDDILDGEKPSMDKWRNRISMVSTLADWRSVRSLDMIDEALSNRIRSASSDGKW